MGKAECCHIADDWLIRRVFVQHLHQPQSLSNFGPHKLSKDHNFGYSLDRSIMHMKGASNARCQVAEGWVSLHNEVWKSYQFTSRARIEVLGNLTVPCCMKGRTSPAFGVLSQNSVVGMYCKLLRTCLSLEVCRRLRRYDKPCLAAPCAF